MTATDELQALLATAKPGPYSAEQGVDDNGLPMDFRWSVAHALTVCEATCVGGAMEEADARAIVAAVNFCRAELPALVAERERLREALSRQGDNMAFLLNNVGVPQPWYDKFTAELAEDRAALAGQP